MSGEESYNNYLLTWLGEDQTHRGSTIIGPTFKHLNPDLAQSSLLAINQEEQMVVSYRRSGRWQAQILDSYVVKTYINDIVRGVDDGSDVLRGPLGGDWCVVDYLH